MAVEPADSVTATAADPERLRRFARWTVENIIDECLCRDKPTRYRDDALVRRADRDVDFDLAQDVNLGFTHTEEQAREYRRIYREAFLAAFHDEELQRERRAQHKPIGFIIVCFR